MKIDKLKKKQSNSNDILTKLIEDCTNPVNGEMDVEKFYKELNKQIELFEKLVENPEEDDDLKSIVSTILSNNQIEKEQKNQLKSSERKILKSLVKIKEQQENINALRASLHNVGGFLDFQTIFKFASRNDGLRTKFNLNERYSKLDVYSTDLPKSDDDLLTKVELDISKRIKKVNEMEEEYFSLNHNGTKYSQSEELSKIRTSHVAPFLDCKDNQLTLVDLNDNSIINDFKLYYSWRMGICKLTPF